MRIQTEFSFSKCKTAHLVGMVISQETDMVKIFSARDS